MIKKILVLKLVLAVSVVTSATENKNENKGRFGKIKSGVLRGSISATFSDAESLDEAVLFIGNAALTSFMYKYPGQSDINTINKLENAYLNDSRTSREDFNKWSLNRRAKTLNEYVVKERGIKTPKGLILSELAIADSLDAPGDWRTRFSAIKDDLSLNQKIQMASRVGKLFNSDYNNPRADDADAGGIVTIETMFQNLKTPELGGVCRDIVYAQAQVLMALGVPEDNLIQVAYRTAGNAHAVLNVQDPDNANNVYQLNYGMAYGKQNPDAAQAKSVDEWNLTPTGTGYLYYDAKGNPMGKGSTEFGKVIRDVFEGSPRFNETPSYSLGKVVLKMTWGEGTYFQGKTAEGDEIKGVAVSKRIETGQLFGADSFMDVGAAYIYRFGDQRKTVELEQNALVLRLNYWLEKEKALGKSVLVKGILGFENQFSFLKTTLTGQEGSFKLEGTNMDPEQTIVLGAQVSKEGKNGFDYFAGVMSYSYFDFANFVEAKGGGFTLALDRVEVNMGVEKSLSYNSSARGEVVFTVREAGVSATVIGKVTNFNNSKTDLEAFYTKPITLESRVFEGSTENWGMGFNKMYEQGQGSFWFRKDEDSDRNTLGVNWDIKF